MNNNLPTPWVIIRTITAQFLTELFLPDVPASATRLERWERRSEGPMFIVSLLFLVFYAIAALGEPDTTGTRIAETSVWIVWLIFLIDYVIRMSLAPQRSVWVWKHWWELALIVLPIFRPLRVLRILPTLVFMQRFSMSSTRVSVAIYTILATTLIIFVSALTLYEAEARIDTTAIHSFGDALWWAIVTVTTVGYGDITPVSLEGRWVAAVLMFTGITFVGIVTAMVSSWLIQKVDSESITSNTTIEELAGTIQSLRQEIGELRSEVQQLRENPE